MWFASQGNKCIFRYDGNRFIIFRQDDNNSAFEPTVSISTKKTGNKISVYVKDNGYGIPKQVRDKIFQPFFTTKPAGQGTGLGLPLSYDIVKAHGVQIMVESFPAGE